MSVPKAKHFTHTNNFVLVCTVEMTQRRYDVEREFFEGNFLSFYVSIIIIMQEKIFYHKKKQPHLYDFFLS